MGVENAQASSVGFLPDMPLLKAEEHFQGHKGANKVVRPAFHDGRKLVVM